MMDMQREWDRLTAQDITGEIRADRDAALKRGALWLIPTFVLGAVGFYGLIVDQNAWWAFILAGVCLGRAEHWSGYAKALMRLLDGEVDKGKP
jgi:predicted cobalt transporter CbtA